MISRTRTLTVLGGIGLAAAALAVLALAGVGGDHRSPPGAGVTASPAPDREIGLALLSIEDLPAGYAAAAAVPSPSRRAVRTNGGTPECRSLFEELLPAGSGAPRAERALTGTGATTLRQAVTVYPGTAADAAIGFDSLRAAVTRCRRFTATLDNGSEVTVEMAPAAAVPHDPNTFTVRLKAAGPDGPLAGYLTIARAGRTLSVLRHLAPPDTTSDPEMLNLIHRALTRLTP